MDNAQTTLYGADWCGDCRRAKTWLRDHGVPFAEVDVSADDAARDHAVELAGGRRNIPVVVLPDSRVLVEPTNAELAAALRPSVSRGSPTPPPPRR